ncbi:DUF1349 domain-containing protein [Candidatus Parcubacteria bacterium]|nr:DUF1349 domain-containing protein [Candidatus Parcubacteria bacterium]
MYSGHAYGGSYSFPNAWVKLTRSGNTLTGYVSSDGSNWNQVGSAVISMTSEVTIGLFVCSHHGNNMDTVVFDNVVVY